MIWRKIFQSEEEATKAIALFSSIVVQIEENEICVYRTKTGFWAIENKCSHQDYPLHGSICDKNDTIVCSFHFLPVHLRTGLTGNKAYRPVKTYPVQVRPDGIYIEV